MTNLTVPFNRATVAPNQLRYVEQVFVSGRLAGTGPISQQVEEKLADLHSGAPVLLTSSCTAALEMCALLLDISPGDQVIVPSFTFVSTANAFALMGAEIIFCDITLPCMNLDISQCSALINEKTKAIVTVNYGGTVGATKELVELAHACNIALIEDNAHGLYAKNDGHPLGTSGILSTLSFHETKNVSCGEGGALVINDERYVERAEVIREKGTDRSKFFRGQIDKYNWISKGSSYLMSEVSAAILLAQLEFGETIQQRRQLTFNLYESSLCEWGELNSITFPHSKVGSTLPYHLFPILFPNLETRSRFIAHMKEKGVTASFHYVPLHKSPAAAGLAQTPLPCPITEDISDRLVRLPLFSDISPREAEHVVHAALDFSC